MTELGKATLTTGSISGRSGNTGSFEVVWVSPSWSRPHGRRPTCDMVPCSYIQNPCLTTMASSKWPLSQSQLSFPGASEQVLGQSTHNQGRPAAWPVSHSKRAQTSAQIRCAWHITQSYTRLTQARPVADF
jgi:hypothetical protein